MTLIPRTPVAVTGVLLGAVLLGGCGSDDQDAAAPEEGVVTLDASPTPSGSASPADPSPDEAAGDDPTGLPDGPPILRAALTVQRALPAATVVSVDDEDDVRGWEVEMVRPNGRTVALVVSPGGDRVTLGPTPTDGDDDASLVGRVRVDVAEALRSAERTAPEGEIESVQLEEEDGAPIWQVDLVDAGGVRIDAVSGESSPDD